MKFGQALKDKLHPPWAKQYLEYNPLKKLISLICLAEGIVDEDSKPIPGGPRARSRGGKGARLPSFAASPRETAPRPRPASTRTGKIRYRA